MKQRFFLFVLLAFVFAAPVVQADQTTSYTLGAIKNALAEGKTVFVDYAASWCSTCAAQERAIKSLRSENPAYDKAITFFRVDWDTFKNEDVTTSRNIPRRSTLLVLKGDKELGRVVAGTSKSEIKALMDKGLAMGE